MSAPNLYGVGFMGSARNMTSFVAALAALLLAAQGTPCRSCRAPGETVRIEPGGMHLMLLDVTMPLEAGTKVTLALRFAGAGAVEVEAPAIDAHAGAPPPRTKPVVRF
jgi:hypothetical protein